MSTCLLLASYPMRHVRHGGQVRSASLAQGLADQGWTVVSAGIYPSSLFPADDHGPDDIVITDAQACADAVADILFGDLLTARHAARAAAPQTSLRDLLLRLRPDVVLLEQPWGWLPLAQALEGLARIQTGFRRPRIVYSSQNIEWRMRPQMYRLGLRRAGSDALVAATQALERDVAAQADLIISISDVEAAEIAADSGRKVEYLPPVSDLAAMPVRQAGRFAGAAVADGVRYAAVLSSNYWPNLEGFLDLFPEGLGFLRNDEQIWVGGALGPSLVADRRYQDFQTINDTRMRLIGSVTPDDKAAFFAGAHCVLVPVLMGAGSKLKAADAIASGRPVITTRHGIEGYGPVAAPAIGRGIYVAESPAEFRELILQALREGMPGCDEAVRATLHQDRLAAGIGALFAKALAPTPEVASTLG